MVFLKQRLVIYEDRSFVGKEELCLFQKDYIVGVFDDLSEAIAYFHDDLECEYDLGNEVLSVLHDMEKNHKVESIICIDDDKIDFPVDKQVKRHYGFGNWRWEVKYIIELFGNFGAEEGEKR